jgi:cell shape-determining protein MreC
MIHLAQPRYLGSPRRSQLGQTGAIVASIIQAAAAMTMATIQLVYQEVAERRARRQWEHDQRSRAAELERANTELNARNDELSRYLDELNGGGSSTGGTAVSSFLGSPYLPYVVIGGGILLVLVMKRRKT